MSLLPRRAPRGRVPDAPENRLRGVVRLSLGADVPQRHLTEATEHAVEAAKAALAGRASVRGEGSLRNEGGGKRVRMELHLRGPGADEQAVLEAEEAFTHAFLARLASRGHAAERVG